MKTSKKLKKIGLTCLIIGIAILITGIVISATDDELLPIMWLIVPGAFIIFISFPILIAGFSPQISNLGAKLHSETMDYAGKEISEAGVKTVEVMEPIINKVADVSSPAINKVVEVAKEGFSSPKKKYCKHCGKNIDLDSKFCKYCSKEQ